MSIRQLNGDDTFYVDITIPGSRKRVRHSTGTSDRKAAQEYHDTLKAKLWRSSKLDEAPAPTWDFVALRWIREMAHKASIRNDATAIRYFTERWRGVPIDQIGREQIAAAVEALPCTDATRNRYVACARAIFRKCAGDWGYLKVAPTVRTYREAKRRIRWLTHTEADRLIEALPGNYAQIARLALATGLRMTNILELEWSQLDMQRRLAWIHPDQAKARQAIAVPLNEDAVAVIRERLGSDQVRVFGYLKRIESRIWKRALLKAGIDDFRFHDLRHTWASWHIQSGTPLHALQEMGGWECVEMVRKYAHLGASHLSAWAGNSARQGKFEASESDGSRKAG